MLRLQLVTLVLWPVPTFSPAKAAPPPLDGAIAALADVDQSSLVHIDSRATASVSELDLKETGVMTFGGAVKKGAYGYLAPKGKKGGQASTVIRFDLGRLVESGTLDVGKKGENLAGFLSIFDDGTYGYLVPYHNKVVRFNLDAFSEESVEVLELADELSDFGGGFSDGTHGYLIPSGEASTQTHGTVVRFDLATFSQVATLDLALSAEPTPDTDLRGFAGGFQDGTYGYAIPHQNEEGQFGKIARFDLATFQKVTVLDLRQKSVELAGFQGGFIEGDYGYLVPEDNGATGGGSEFGKLVRFSLKTFDIGSVTYLDLSQTDSEFVGFYQGFSDGTYAYLSPGKHSKVARIALANFPDSVPEAIDIGEGMRGFEAGFLDPQTNSGYLVCADIAESCQGKVARINNINPEPPATPTPAPAQGGGGGSSGWAWFIVIILLLAGGGAGAYYMYLQKEEQARRDGVPRPATRCPFGI